MAVTSMCIGYDISWTRHSCRIVRAWEGAGAVWWCSGPGEAQADRQWQALEEHAVKMKERLGWAVAPASTLGPPAGSPHPQDLAAASPGPSAQMSGCPGRWLRGSQSPTAYVCGPGTSCMMAAQPSVHLSILIWTVAKPSLSMPPSHTLAPTSYHLPPGSPAAPLPAVGLEAGWKVHAPRTRHRQGNWLAPFPSAHPERVRPVCPEGNWGLVSHRPLASRFWRLAPGQSEQASALLTLGIDRARSNVPRGPAALAQGRPLLQLLQGL